MRKRQSELFDLVSGFVYSQILFACVELDLLTQVGEGARLADLSARTGLGEDEARRLVEGAASLRLLQENSGLYRLGDLGAALLANPGVLAMIRHHGAFYQDMADPVALLRSSKGDTHLSRYWDYALRPDPSASEASKVEAYSRLMAESQTMVAEEVLVAVDFSPHTTLLDVGGGHGAFLSRVAERHPSLKLQLFDLPAVVKQAKEKLKDAGLQGRSEVFGGSFFDAPLPKGADLISLVRILHDHDDDAAQAILNAVYEALPGGGTLIVCEPMSTGGSALRISDAYFNFYLQAMGSGRPRSPAALQEMLRIAGFRHTKLLTTRFPLITSVIRAHR